MDSVARQLLQESKDELTRLQSALPLLGGRFGFGIIVPTGLGTVSKTQWDTVNGQIDDFALDHPVAFEKRNIWIEPSPSGRQCIRWWGSERAVGEFCKWARRARFESRLFEKGITEDAGHQRTLRMLWNVAHDTAELSRHVDVVTIPPADGLGNCEFFDVVDSGIAFALSIIEFFLKRRHHLTVDFDAEAVVLDGESFSTPRNSLLVLQLLLKHEGYWIAESELTKACPELEGVKMSRVVKAIPEKVRSLIQSTAGRGQRILLGDDPLIQPMS